MPIPLSTFLMIYICVITDVAPCLSLVFESAESDLMKSPPHSTKLHLLDGFVYLQSYGLTGTLIFHLVSARFDLLTDQYRAQRSLWCLCHVLLLHLALLRPYDGRHVPLLR